jgi:hypothetical protein
MIKIQNKLSIDKRTEQTANMAKINTIKKLNNFKRNNFKITSKKLWKISQGVVMGL